MQQAEVITILFGLVQLIVVGLGVWMLKTLVAILTVLEGLKMVISSNKDDIKELQQYRNFSESKLKEMWAWYSRHISKSDGGLTPFKDRHSKD